MVLIATPEPITEVDRWEPDLSSSDLRYLCRAVLWLGILFFCAAGANIVIAQTVKTLLFAGMEFYVCWCVVAAIIQYFFLRLQGADLGHTEYNEVLQRRRSEPSGTGLNDQPDVSRPSLPRFASRWQWVIFFGIIILIALLLKRTISAASLSRETIVPLRAATVIFLAEGCALYFFGNFAKAVAARSATELLGPILTLTRIASLAAFLSAALLFLFLSTTRDYSAWLGWALIGFTTLLIGETLIRFSTRFYHPKSLRSLPGPAGASVMLEALLGRRQGLGSAVKSFEDLLGVKLREVWIVRYLRQTAELVIFGTIVLGWLSTCLTSVPAGSRAVRMVFGRYQPVPLKPGLHLTWPWPIERLEIVETEMVRQISLGFDKDLTGPVLWNEPHVIGEKNLLVGDGESLLTIDVPILYRIADPVRYLETTTDAEQALLVLAERKLIQVAGSSDSFRIMTDDRAEIARKLQASLQQEVDRLGLQIVFVGLKDVHPPVDVAAAFQEVISAQEQKEQTIDLARASRARALPEARALANRLRTQEEASYKQRVAAAQGEAARFSAIVTADRENSGVFRLRLKLEAIEQVLGNANKTILAVPAQTKQEFYLDLRNTATLPPP